jgi:hypothetical protein
MTISDLLAECTRAEEWHAQNAPTLEPQFSIKIFRRCKGRTARIIPGLTARLVQWSDGDHPVCVGFLRCADVRRVTGTERAVRSDQE